MGDLRSIANTSVKQILFGIGSGGPPTDFANLIHIYRRPALKFMLFLNFRALMALGVDGFDYDCEEFTGANGTDTAIMDVMVDMVTRFHRMGATVQTFVPYDNIDLWMEC